MVRCTKCGEEGHAAAPASVPEDMPARLRKLRTDRGESLRQAAAAIGCTNPHLWELERGSSANPGLLLLRAMGRHYGVSVAYIIGDEA